MARSIFLVAAAVLLVGAYAQTPSRCPAIKVDTENIPGNWVRLLATCTLASTSSCDPCAPRASGADPAARGAVSWMFIAN